MEFHRENLPKVVSDALAEGKLESMRDLEAIAVTIGPGQTHSLNEGIKFAQKLAIEHDLPLIPVSHIESHVMSGRHTQASQGLL